MIPVTKYKKGDIVQHKTDSTLKRQIIEIYYNKKDCCGLIEETYYQTIIVGSKDIPPTQMNESVIDKYYKKLEE